MTQLNNTTAETSAAAGYVAPALTVLGSVEAITRSSVRGSFSDFKARSDKK